MTKLISKISKLSIIERIQLVQEILATIAKEEEVSQFTADQIQEFENRSASIKNGTAKTIPWEEIENTLIKRYDL